MSLKAVQRQNDDDVEVVGGSFDHDISCLVAWFSMKMRVWCGCYDLDLYEALSKYHFASVFINNNSNNNNNNIISFNIQTDRPHND